MVEMGCEVLVMKQFHDASNKAFVEAFGANGKPVDALQAWKDHGLDK